MNNQAIMGRTSKNESETTLGSSFFDTLWPLLLDDNVCHIEYSSVDYFQRRQKFQQLRWHTLLAKIGYPSYQLPLDLHCCTAFLKQQAAEESATQAVNDLAVRTSAAAHGDYEPKGSLAIKPIDQQLADLKTAQHRRQKLAYDFANRTYPWTMQSPSQDLGFEITTELLMQFKKPIEYDILISIQCYNCKLMVIDAGTEFCINEFHRWIKFRRYLQMVVLVRCPRVERQLQLLGIFHTLLVEENLEQSWHEELHCSLHAGLKYAKKLELFKNCTDPFVFVFSRYRGICTCDTFKVLRKQ